MKKISLNTAENQDYWMEKDILSAFRQQPIKNNQIQQGMSPLEIADIISDRLIDIVRQQFETTKEEYLAKRK
jgi:hypothetical protein